MSTNPLTPAQHFILAAAIEHTDGRIERFPDNLKGGARTKVADTDSRRAEPSGRTLPISPEAACVRAMTVS